MTDAEDPPADDSEFAGQKLIRAIDVEFAGDDRPATVEMLAKCYGAMAATQDALIAMSALIAKSDPAIVFTDRFREAHSAITINTQLIAKNVIDLAGKGEGDADE